MDNFKEYHTVDKCYPDYMVYSMGSISEFHAYVYIKVRTDDTGTCSHPHPYGWGVLA